MQLKTKQMKKLLPLIAILVFLWSCQTKKPTQDATDPGPVQFSLTELWKSDTTMKTPESVLFDPARNVLYVANMNRVDEGENNGFITKMATDGTVIDQQWVSGLIEPRGMGIYGDLLFATDMTRVIVIDIPKGELVKTIPIEGAVFLNDLTISKDGVAYFSDSETGKIHKLEDGELSLWYSDLKGPNVLFDHGEYLIMAESGAGEVRKSNKESGEAEIIAMGVGVDGIEYTGIEDYYIISEWGGRMYVIGNDTIQKILDTQEQKINSADIGYDITKKIVYVPTFFDNRVVAYEFKME
jgi:DNA-binding beta-propeller fold protein YncE